MARSSPFAGMGIEIADRAGVDRSPIDLKLRVIMVTTRAALRHAPDDPVERRVIVARGRELLTTLAAETTEADGREAIDRALAELDEMESA